MPNTDYKSKANEAPGTLVHVGEASESRIRITAICYHEENITEKEITDTDEISTLINANGVSWINVDGVHKTELIEMIGNAAGIHSLVLEDIVNTDQRAKVEDYGDFVYFVMKMTDIDKKGKLDFEQVSIILGKNFILSFQERQGDLFEPTRTRIRQNKGKVRHMGADYLAYLLMDAVVDRYFLIMEEFGLKIDELETSLIKNSRKEDLSTIYVLKKDLLNLRKAVWPLRETVSHLQRVESKLISADINVYLRDFYDHIMRVIDTIESYRDTTSSMIDLYLSSSSIRTNEVMKVLTIMSTIFIPLTFITGFYGMNLDHMIEIHSPWTYPAVVGIMLGMVMVQLYWFRRKGWL